MLSQEYSFGVLHEFPWDVAIIFSIWSSSLRLVNKELTLLRTVTRASKEREMEPFFDELMFY